MIRAARRPRPPKPRRCDCGAEIFVLPGEEPASRCDGCLLLDELRRSIGLPPRVLREVPE